LDQINAYPGFFRGENINVCGEPSLHDGDEWTRFEAARRAMSEHFFNSEPAPRYRIGGRASA
jgi:hypothetical protein